MAGFFTCTRAKEYKAASIACEVEGFEAPIRVVVADEALFNDITNDPNAPDEDKSLISEIYAFLPSGFLDGNPTDDEIREEVYKVVRGEC